MARRTNDIDRLRNKLVERDSHRASRLWLRRELNWDTAKLERVLQRALAAEPAIGVGKGGHILFRGSELGSGAGVGLYSDVAAAVESDRMKSALGWRMAVPLHTSRIRSGGVWTQPDLVVLAHPRRRETTTSRKIIHAIEIEQRKGFDIRSVYQAHAQARGADHAWVFTFRSGVVDAKGCVDERIAWAADSLGVGIVAFETSTRRNSYLPVIQAKALEPSDAERKDLQQRLPLPSDDPRWY